MLTKHTHKLAEDCTFAIFSNCLYQLDLDLNCRYSYHADHSANNEVTMTHFASNKFNNVRHSMCLNIGQTGTSKC